MRSGDCVTPNAPGWLTGDKDKATVEAADCATITIPAGGKAFAWIAEADAGTWQVGENAPCSAKYPIAWWSCVILDDACETDENWKVLTQAVNEKKVDSGALRFMSTGANAENRKKNFGLYRALGAGVSGGCYRISFKTMIDAGGLSVKFGDAIKSTFSLFKSSETLLSLSGKNVTGYNSLKPSVTVSGGVPQAHVNLGRWVDVDLIIDRDKAKAWMSVGGSDYVEWVDKESLSGTFPGRTWKYLGVTMPGHQSSYGGLDDVKILKLGSALDGLMR